ncbi:Retrovirus-related Pol polyprotein from transposon TNT 1-94 [Eumeta japonica]|uniref:Retrovirus-related Pol polyprotein from transposon TNT 1-94 n=1 Tax=Eumeta variegata TaxID=151549 RepID=A0A4C1XPK0_EUMVA|nr:Retrovirus-related Pol polyprotein from transposon TNT 1-94 [Eumeta japonica]
MGSNMFNLEKLVGRENFATWKFSMKTYLEHEDLWCCVECPKDKPVDASKDVKAKSKLILLLDPQNYVHVQECKTAKQVWDSLQRAFDDNGLTRRVGLLKDLINTTLESSNSVEDYVSKIMNTAHKLRNIGFEVNDEWLGTLMLAGLPEEYKPMIMGLESSAANLLSVSTIVKNGHKVTFSTKGCEVRNGKDEVICTATLNNNLYIMDTSTEVAHLTSSTQSCDTYLWHLRMGHLNFHDVKKLPDVTEGVTLTQQQSNIACTHCMEGSHGIIHQTSIPYTPQQNGMAERMNRTLVERARCMLFYANLEKKYWAEALATAAYVVNRSPTKSLQGKTPYEMWKGMKPNLSHMKIFGSEAMVHVPSVKRQKWDKKSVKMILVGYCENSKGYRFMDPRSHKVIKSRDVVFMENVLSNCETHVPATSSSVQPESTQSSSGKENHTPKTSTSERLLGSKDQIHKKAIVKAQVSMILTLNKQTEVQNPKKSLLCLFTDLTDPQTVEEALASPQAADWKQAMNEEYASLMKNKTWSLTELPPGKKALPCKWVFKRKTDHSGNVLRYKARLVIKGYAQRWGSDYEEIYSPVVKYTTIRYLFALAARYGLEIDQMDAVSAFLQGEIDRDIYMQQPEEYKQGEEVCILHKSIYGLKQASRLWNVKLNSVLQKLDMQQSRTDPCVYYNVEKNTYIAIWVDDIILFTAQESAKTLLKEKLKEHFEMKDIGPASQCVGLHITRDRDKIMLDQEKYIKEILARFRMTDCKPVKTPVEVGIKFNKKTENEKTTDYPYQQAIGSLLYVAQGTRPDISFAVNTLSRFNKNPTAEHWNAVKRIFRYLQGTKDLKLTYTKDGDENITGYCDADWASDVCDRKSCTGYTFLLQGGAISWRSHKQQTVALSTAEAEYMAMSSAAQEALWLQQLHAEVGQQQKNPLVIFSDNESAIKLSNNNCYLPRSRHIDIRYHFLKDHVNNFDIKFSYVKGENMIADNLTKGTTADKHLYCIENGVAFKGRFLERPNLDFSYEVTTSWPASPLPRPFQVIRFGFCNSFAAYTQAQTIAKRDHTPSRQSPSPKRRHGREARGCSILKKKYLTRRMFVIISKGGGVDNFCYFRSDSF